jgi:flagellar M-ring protein FliF
MLKPAPAPTGDLRLAGQSLQLADGTVASITVDDSGNVVALPASNGEFEQKIDIAKIEGQVRASSVKKVAEFIEKHPEESVAILRSWLHEN